jgi:hypothetical protein
MSIAHDFCDQPVMRSRFEFAVIRLNGDATMPITGEAMPFFDWRELGYYCKPRGTQGTI